MPTDNTYKILTWSVILLIIVNIILISFIYTGYKRNERMRPQMPAEFLSKQLDLTDSQRNKLHQLADMHHRESEMIREEVKSARDKYFALMKAPNIDDSTKNAAANSIAQHLKEIEILTFDHFQKVRAICSPKQQGKFDEIINDVLHMVSGPPPPPKGGIPRPPGPPQPPPPE